MRHAPKRLTGVGLILRLVVPDDADYIHRLRTDTAYNTHLSAVSGTAEDQRRWIEAYKTREAEGREYYYVIMRKDGERCGIFRIYDIDHEAGTFTWGSWILDDNKPVLATLECLYLIHTIGFDLLGLQRALYDVLRTNRTGLKFYRRFAEETHSDEYKVFFAYTRQRFEADRALHFSNLRWETDEIGT